MNAMEPAEMPRAIHVCHHRCMTLYFSQVFAAFARQVGWQYHSTVNGVPPDSAELVLVHDGSFPRGAGECRGTHIVRDPRDLIVSGYFYHLRTSETWCT